MLFQFIYPFSSHLISCIPRKMKTICCHNKTLTSMAATDATSNHPATQRTLGKIIDSAELLITKWDPDSCSSALFSDNKRETAVEFLRCVINLQNAMHLMTSDSQAFRAQNLLQTAMKRLRKEFYDILSTKRAQLDPESVSARSPACCSSSDGENVSVAEVEETTAMADLRSIADCMISLGYAAECTDIYIMIRKSIIDERVFRLGVEKLSASQVNKFDWEALEFKIQIWLEAVKISVSTLFAGERALCDHIFASSDAVRESCFNAVSRDAAMILLEFPEMVATGKKSFQKLFRFLDMYAAILENWPAIESIFDFAYTSDVRSQALNSLARLAGSVPDILSDFETTVQNDSSKTVVSGGGIHPLTISAMDYLSTLVNYKDVLANILAPSPAVSQYTTWLVLVLLCNLVSKAKQYSDTSLPYLFLMNNLQHVLHKARGSELQHLLGEEWMVSHGKKVRHFAEIYERLGWSKVFESLPGDPKAAITPAAAKEYFLKFNSSFEEAYRRDSSRTVDDSKLRDEMRASIERKLLVVRRYRLFYETHRLTVGGERNARLLVRYAPEDIRNFLSDLFLASGGQVIDSSSSSSASSCSSHRRRSIVRRSLGIRNRFSQTEHFNHKNTRNNVPL